MEITIVVPIYNVAPYISACLHSVMSQTYQGEMECLLIDDCGTDNSMELVENILEEYHGKIVFHIYHHEQNRGLSAARNTGIKYATGDYIYFLDSDDEITPDCIEKLVKPLYHELYDFVIGGYKTVGGSQKTPPLLIDHNTILRNGEITKSYYEGKWYMMVCGKLCRANFLKENNLIFEEGLLHEDELWSFQLACLAKSMYVINQKSYIYKIRSGSITMNSKTQERRAVAFQKIINKMVDFVLEKKTKSRYAYLKIFAMLTALNEYLPVWTDKSQTECNDIIKRQRRTLSRIPYCKRFISCMVSLRKAIGYGGVILPTPFYLYYNRIIHYFIHLH